MTSFGDCSKASRPHPLSPLSPASACSLLPRRSPSPLPNQHRQRRVEYWGAAGLVLLAWWEQWGIFFPSRLRRSTRRRLDFWMLDAFESRGVDVLGGVGARGFSGVVLRPDRGCDYWAGEWFCPKHSSQFISRVGDLVVDLRSIFSGGDTGLTRTEIPPCSWSYIPSRFVELNGNSRPHFV
jgi:hypothetical protein